MFPLNLKSNISYVQIMSFQMTNLVSNFEYLVLQICTNISIHVYSRLKKVTVNKLRSRVLKFKAPSRYYKGALTQNR